MEEPSLLLSLVPSLLTTIVFFFFAIPISSQEREGYRLCRLVPDPIRYSLHSVLFGEP